MTGIEYVYIAGPMRGIPHFNAPAFDAAAARIRDMGINVFNPAEEDRQAYGPDVHDSPAGDLADLPDFDLGRALGEALLYIAVIADAVCVLPGWQQSVGASLEVQAARAVGKPILCLTEDGLVPRVRAIGLSGYARSGKDTVAGFLADEGYQRVAFADIMREALAALDPLVFSDSSGGWTVRELLRHHKGDWERVKPLGARELLQRLGTEVGRNMLGENVWVDATLNRVPDGSKIVVTDCRFPNEAQAVKALGGRVWRIERPGTGPINDHPSETALDGWLFDLKILNDGSLEDLAYQVAYADRGGM